MVLAYDRVNLPVANTGFFGNDGGAFVNTDTISGSPYKSMQVVIFIDFCHSAAPTFAAFMA
jgi:hypothetical protein